jgi:hypothetical protein
MPKFELWFSESQSSSLLLFAEDHAWDHLKESDSKIMWECEAADYEEARRKRDAFCDSEGFQIAAIVSPAPAPSPTTKVTWIFYVDKNGEQRVEMAGWGPSVQFVNEHLTERQVEACDLLGQVFVERPYREISEAPEALTVVKLRSRDGTKAMIQEFVGHIPDGSIPPLLTQRLGPDLGNWEIGDVRAFKRTSTNTTR